jgi:hypothetical protein
MKRNLLSTIFFSLFSIVSFAYADAYNKSLESVYVSIRGFQPDKDTVFRDYLVYFYDLFVVFGTIIAVLMIIASSIQIVLSRGEVGNLGEAKKRLYGAVFGIIILMGSWSILFSLNPNFVSVNLDPVEVGESLPGINLTRESDGFLVWMGQDEANTKENYSQIKWLSSAEDLPKIYVYSEPNFKGVLTEVKNGDSINIKQGSSIYFFWRTEGVYLYDNNDYTLNKKLFPLYTKTSIVSLSNVNNENFDNVIKSIDFIQPKDENNPKFFSILFSESDYRGSCSWVLDDISSLDLSRGDENKDPIKNNNLSSIMIFKTKNQSKTVTFYNRTNCQYIEKDPTSKKCSVNSLNRIETFESSCSDLYDNGDILSFELEDNTGVLIQSKDKNYCQFFKKNGLNSCINVIKYGSTYNLEETKEIRPYFFTVFSIE